MSYEPDLRIRRRRPHLLGNLMAILICMIWAFSFLAWGLTPGPSPDPRPSVTTPPPLVLCPDPTVLSDPDCH
jgi:hypothetical protein